MSSEFAKNIRKAAVGTVSFFVPKTGKNLEKSFIDSKDVAILIPTYAPNADTYRLIESITYWTPTAHIVIIDDCTPLIKDTKGILKKIKALSKVNKNVVLLRTPDNTLKAGALNYGLAYLLNLPKVPNVVFTFDDDVIINQDTIPAMVNALYEDTKVGAVCSQVRVKNKNVNILTRLQALEYHSFNITKISDNGFLKGPLVMQGMLTAFRMSVMKEMNGFTLGHLIEDYDITARMKQAGWKVKIAQGAHAWTTVPETLEELWKQRIRWTVGGLQVLQEFWKKTAVVYQDLVGHAFFLSLLAMIAISFLLVGAAAVNSTLVLILVTLSLVNFIISFIFNIATMKTYVSRDRKDWMLKFAILPELIYSNVLSLVLIGSYLFFLYMQLANAIIAKTGITMTYRPYRWGLSAFKKAGFSTNWGTR